MSLYRILVFCLPLLALIQSGHGLTRPNIIVFFADDISAREIPIYGSSVWSDPYRENSSDLASRAQTPVLDRLANEGCWIKTAWAATVCKPSRALIMTGRYAHRQKWWNNGDVGQQYDETGALAVWPVYESSPLLIADVASKAGYGTYWTGKVHLTGEYKKFGFDEACITPGFLFEKDNPYTDFKLDYKKIDGKRTLCNVDTGEPVKTYGQYGWYWNPHVRLINDPSAPGEIVWWPNTAEAQKEFGLNTYGPDVELEFAFDFMKRKQQEGKPFFIYHASHLGHDAFDWFDPDTKSNWPGTPIVSWDGHQYTRTDPNVTGDGGVYDTHGTVTEPGLHHHINYIDYQLWQYTEKLKEMGIDDNTIIIFTADNGTGGYGKNTSEQQRGCHVPMIIYAPGMTKHGEQNVLASIADILPTIAELAGFKIPEDYEVNGESLVPFLFTDKPEHREWIYSYRGPEQIIRGKTVLRDGRHKWWDVTADPADTTSFPEIKDWSSVSEVHRSESKKLLKVLPQFDNYDESHDAPGVPMQPKVKGKGRAYFRGS